MIVTVRRQKAPGEEAYYQSFDVKACGRVTVSHILEELNGREPLCDVDGKAADRISWERSCLQKICGSCAMVINGKPALACSEFIDTAETKELVLEPLSVFPVICDLMVDRSIIDEHQKLALMFLGERTKPDAAEHEQQYLAAKCLKCGLCLEVCPNYAGNGGKFFGALFADEAYLLHSSTADRRKEIAKEYRKHFERWCSKSLSCREVCPMKIQTLSSIGYMNSKI